MNTAVMKIKVAFLYLDSFSIVELYMPFKDISETDFLIVNGR